MILTLTLLTLPQGGWYDTMILVLTLTLPASGWLA